MSNNINNNIVVEYDADNVDNAIKQDLISKVDAVLPQTQCTRCNYPSCMDYAKAIVLDNIPINQCPPGGEYGIQKLANIMQLPVIPLNTDHGLIHEKTIVRIIEEDCIGCTLCIKACPVDAIIGTNKKIHTVLDFECTGCDLCIPACPVDCIEVIVDSNPNWTADRVKKARENYTRHTNRKQQNQHNRNLKLASLNLS